LVGKGLQTATKKAMKMCQEYFLSKKSSTGTNTIIKYFKPDMIIQFDIIWSLIYVHSSPTWEGMFSKGMLKCKGFTWSFIPLEPKVKGPLIKPTWKFKVQIQNWTIRFLHA
jgi:hypothetical protein